LKHSTPAVRRFARLTQILFCVISFDHCFMVSAIQKESFGLKVISDW
jgi:hypothetical protein